MDNKGKLFIVSATLAFIAIITVCCSNIQATSTSENTITVNCLAKSTKPKSMAGFLLSVNSAQPADKYISPLQPAYWRISSRNRNVLKRVELFGAKPIFIVSDLFKYPGVDKAKWRTPLAAMSRWKDTVKSIALQYNSMSRKPVYDIWNEPNGKFFWDDTKESFFETFKSGYDQIRSMPGGPTSQIAGPSVSKFDMQFIEAFLDYCLVNNIKLDVLSWHEFRTGDDIATVKKDILLAKSRFVNNPKYAPLSIKSIQVNEVIGQQDQFSPGSILAYLYFLEKGGADAACKACWPESNGKSNCFNNSLDGLLTSDNLSPRAAWWAYKYYNLSLTNRVSSVSSNNNVVSFANYQSSKLQLLVAYFGDNANNGDRVNLNLNVKSIGKLAAFKNRKTVSIKVTDLPDTGEEQLVKPPVTLVTTGKIINGSLKFALPKLSLKAACVVEIS